ncbi:unnamed protein product [Phaeothamnion confervicola]
MWIRGGCSASSVAANLTFFPPDPCYKIVEREGVLQMELEAFLDAELVEGTGITIEVYKVRTRARNVIPIVLYRRAEARYTIIYSHGNATDIGAMHDRYCGIALHLGVNVVGYDYSGYGAATGRPSEKNVYLDMRAVYDWALQSLCGGAADGHGLPGGGPAMTAAEAEAAEAAAGGAGGLVAVAANGNGNGKGSSRGDRGSGARRKGRGVGSCNSGGIAAKGRRLPVNCAHGLILYGQSVGSGAACYMAAVGSVAGLILHSPILSGMRVLTESRALACFDIFPNIDRIGAAGCPVTVFHGLQDEEVHWSHGQQLFAAVPARDRREPWWCVDRGHNDMCLGRSDEYHRRLANFVASLDAPPVVGAAASAVSAAVSATTAAES